MKENQVKVGKFAGRGEGCTLFCMMMHAKPISIEKSAIDGDLSQVLFGSEELCRSRRSPPRPWWRQQQKEPAPVPASATTWPPPSCSPPNYPSPPPQPTPKIFKISSFRVVHCVFLWYSDHSATMSVRYEPIGALRPNRRPLKGRLGCRSDRRILLPWKSEQERICVEFGVLWKTRGKSADRSFWTFL